MQYHSISLRAEFPTLPKTHTEPTLISYTLDNSVRMDIDRRRPGVLICPGGGYWFLADRVSEPVALAFMKEGFSAFVLKYSLAPDRWPCQLLEVSAAMAYLRRHAEEYHLDPDMLTVAGFSAGGHVAGSLGTLWDAPFIREQLHLAPGENRPDAMLLSYPVITAGEFAHRGSFDNLLGEAPSKALLEQVSLEKHVTQNTPPTFLWHTFTDRLVPVENSLLMADALAKAGVPFDLHIFRDGPHGLSLANAATAKAGVPQQLNAHAENWLGLFCRWLRDLFDYRF